MTKPKLFIVTGISGSGKTTVARYLVRKGEVAFDSKINPGLYQFVDRDGNIAETVRLNDGEWRNKYKWSLNKEKLEMLLEQNHQVSRVFLCGRANLFQYWDLADKVFLLEVDGDILLKRLNSESRDNLFAKDKATQDRLLNDLNSIQRKIIEKGAVIVNARGSVDNVVNQILQESEV